MTILALRLQKRFVSTSMGAVATLRQVADEKNNSITHGKRMAITIPANNGTDAREVAVDPGRWFVEATLPSGEVISEEVFVAKDSTVPLTLQSADNSPREWLGWQHLVGNIEGEAGLRKLRTRAKSALDEAENLLRSTADRSVFESVGEFGEDLAKLLSRKSDDAPSVKVSARPRLRGKDAWSAIWNSDQAAAIATPSDED